MKKTRYKKASLYYEKGELEKALNECEIAISENLKDSAVLNLKGIILYQKGLLNEAISCWNINREYNDDNLSKSYIKDVQSDKILEDMYDTAEELLKNLEIDEALEIFKLCQKSDFNYLKVNTAIALCYFKKGQIEESKFYIIKVLKVDKNFLNAKSLLKEINSIDGNRKVKNEYVLVAILLIAIFCGSIYYGSSKLGHNSNEVNEPIYLDNDKINKPNENYEYKIDFSTLGQAITNKDVDKLYKLLKNVDKQKFNEEEISKINSAELIIKDIGVQQFYTIAQENIKNGDNKKAYDEITKAYEYGSESYLYPHIVYFRAFIAKELLKIDEAIKYYEEYTKLNNKQMYMEEVLYNLVVLNKDIDKNKSKEYAKQITKDYPESMYNNKVIQGIINGE